MGLLGDVVGSLTGKDAKDAAGAQVDASKEAMGLVRQYYGDARSDLAPYASVGKNALYSLSGLYGGPSQLESERDQVLNQFYNRISGIKGGVQGAQNILGLSSVNDDMSFANLTDDQIAQYDWQSNKADLQRLRDIDQQIAAQGEQPSVEEQFQTSPGYQFRLNEGVNALENSAAAQGLLNSGTAAKGITEYGQNFASNEYGNYVNQLMGLAGMGQNASTNQANAALQTGNSLAQLQTGIGNARASGYIGQGNALRGLVSNLAGSAFKGAGQAGGFSKLFG